MDVTTQYYGKYRGTVVNNIDPMQIGRLQVQVPDVARPDPVDWALPCFPIAGKQMGMYVRAADRRRRLGRVRAGRSRLPDLDAAAGAARPPRCRRSRWLAQPPLPNIVLQTAAQNTLLISDLPGPTGGIMLKTPTGAIDHRSTTPASTSPNGKGAIDHDDRRRRSPSTTARC